ncbi:hypothetical protein HanXRQr2_Chr11g0468721 [Helianthus annuus]|uniref:Uncharacterized protein n=1 Tax=Helianthus annuus TaxID=4232 RepID=A0A9K3HKQ7_HELAN|nr:hypothetical protein HanXRQr2_Chr11g0468721 [Helianthus annuus]
MLASVDLQGNYNMSSQISFHSIKKPSDFTFCDIPKRKYHKEQDENKNHENPLDFSPPLWSKTPPSNCTGSSSATNTMAKGRKELMEMINDLPESCYELSLKDMVAEDTEDSGYAIEDKVDVKSKVKGKKKGAKRRPISRSVSLDTGVFLLKMFVPSSFGSKKQRVSRSTSIDGLNKHDIDVKQWKTWFIQNKSNISRRSYNNDRCCNTTTKKRYEEGTLKPGCWFKLTNQKWCIFF